MNVFRVMENCCSSLQLLLSLLRRTNDEFDFDYSLALCFAMMFV